VFHQDKLESMDIFVDCEENTFNFIQVWTDLAKDPDVLINKSTKTYGDFAGKTSLALFIVIEDEDDIEKLYRSSFTHAQYLALLKKPVLFPIVIVDFFQFGKDEINNERRKKIRKYFNRDYLTIKFVSVTNLVDFSYQFFINHIKDLNHQITKNRELVKSIENIAVKECIPIKPILEIDKPDSQSRQQVIEQLTNEIKNIRMRNNKFFRWGGAKIKIAACQNVLDYIAENPDTDIQTILQEIKNKPVIIIEENNKYEVKWYRGEYINGKKQAAGTVVTIDSALNWNRNKFRTKPAKSAQAWSNICAQQEVKKLSI